MNWMRGIDLRGSVRLPSAKQIIFLTFACALCAGVRGQDRDCKVIPSGQEFWVRLTEPVSTYSSRVGADVRAILIDSPQCGDVPVFSTGIPVEGRIIHVRKVGLGILHGSSAITIEFNELLADPKALSMKAHIEEIANGRESIKAGTIEGVGTKNTPQRLMSTRLLHLPEWNPDTYWIFMLRRAIFPFSPEPEIYLPQGTDLRLELTAPLQLPEGFQNAASQDQGDDDEKMEQGVRANLVALPSRSVTGSGKPSDAVNLAFLGSPQQIEAGFEAAGWTYGDLVSTWSVLREMRAMSSLNSYAHLPISRQWLNGKPPDFRFQKSFDSYEKREHIRIWKEDALENGLWAGGVIRETSAEWSIRSGRFIHHVDADLDAEREKVVRELSLTGCVDHVYRVQRTETPEQLRVASGDILRTDGSLAVIQMKDCEAPSPSFAAGEAMLPSRPRSRVTRFVRRQALSIHDLWRSNVIYESFDISRTVIHSLKDRRVRRRAAEEAATVKSAPVRIETGESPKIPAQSSLVPLQTTEAY